MSSDPASTRGYKTKPKMCNAYVFSLSEWSVMSSPDALDGLTARLSGNVPQAT